LFYLLYNLLIFRDISNNLISTIYPNSFTGLKSLNSLWVVRLFIFYSAYKCLVFCIEIISKCYHLKFSMNWIHYNFCECRRKKIRRIKACLVFRDSFAMIIIPTAQAWKRSLCRKIHLCYLYIIICMKKWILIYDYRILSNNQLVHVPFGIFHHEFTHLQLLWVSIAFIACCWYRLFLSMFKLYFYFILYRLLNANKIVCIHGDTFRGLEKLSLLSLYDNQLKSLANETFKPLKNLQTL